jgi:hypothetical protein
VYHVHSVVRAFPSEHYGSCGLIRTSFRRCPCCHIVDAYLGGLDNTMPPVIPVVPHTELCFPEDVDGVLSFERLQVAFARDVPLGDLVLFSSAPAFVGVVETFSFLPALDATVWVQVPQDQMCNRVAHGAPCRCGRRWQASSEVHPEKRCTSRSSR